MRYGPAILISAVVLVSAASIIGYMEYQRQREIKIVKLKEDAAEIKARWIDARRPIFAYPVGSRDYITAAISHAADVDIELTKCQWEIRRLQGFDDPQPSEDKADHINSLVHEFNDMWKINPQPEHSIPALAPPVPGP